jgi:RND family efflux transporter MFP subunit
MSVEMQDRQSPRPTRFLKIGWLLVVVVVFVVSGGLVFAHQTLIARQSSQLEAEQARGPRVLVVQVAESSAARSLTMPAVVHGYIETPVYANIAGYMKRILVDKGDRVHTGELIAVIESPETDKQVADALANYRLQLVTDRRYQTFYRSEVISLQDADTQHEQMLQARATFEQERALQSYEIVQAPFDGSVTARYVDPGTLIPQSTASSSANPIVSLATLKSVRVYANVPQTIAGYVNDGDAATITVNGLPGHQFRGTVTRHQDALDPNTRTMPGEVDMPNSDLLILPGMYADLQITAHISASGILVADDALVLRNNKIYLPLVRNDHIHLVEVKPGRDDGYQVEASGDIQPGDLVAMNVGQAAHDGETVQPVQKAGS